MTDLTLGPALGKLTALCADPRGFLVVWQEGGTLVLAQLHPDGARRVSDVTIDCGGVPNSFPRVYVDARGASWLAYRENPFSLGRLLNLTTSQRYELGVVYGNYPIAFGDDCVVWHATAAYQRKMAALVDPSRRSAVIGPFGAGTGLSHIAGGTVYGLDELRTSEPGMVNPQRALGCVVGENADAGPDRNIARLEDGRVCELWAGVASFMPQITAGHGRWAVGTYGGPGPRVALLAESDFTVPPEPEPEPDPHDFDLVPDGTLVTGALRLLIGEHPNQQGDIVCLNKNTPPEAEWRKVVRLGEMTLLLHWADASRFPGDPGWWIDAPTPVHAPIWAADEFYSGVTTYETEPATIIDLRPGVPPNRWRQTNTLYGTTGGGVMVQFDPRFPGQYDGGYEKQWVLPDGRSRWQYLKTPIAAKGVLPWGDPSMDVVVQEAENGPTPPGPHPPQPFIPCPRPLVSTPQPKPERPMIDLSEAEARAGYPAPSDIVDGARNLFREHVLPRDVIEGRLSEGAERYFGQHYYPTMAKQQVRSGVPGSAEGWGGYSVAALNEAKRIYDRDQRPTTQPQPGQPFSGPIAVAGKDFVTP